MVILPAQKPGSLVTQAFAHHGPWPSQQSPEQKNAIGVLMGFIIAGFIVAVIWRAAVTRRDNRHRRW